MPILLNKLTATQDFDCDRRLIWRFKLRDCILKTANGNFIDFQQNIAHLDASALRRTITAKSPGYNLLSSDVKVG